MLGRGRQGLWFCGGEQWAGDWLQVRAAMSHSLWCCQDFRERMKVITCQWRDLHAKEAQLKTHMEESGKTLKVHLLD